MFQLYTDMLKRERDLYDDVLSKLIIERASHEKTKLKLRSICTKLEMLENRLNKSINNKNCQQD